MVCVHCRLLHKFKQLRKDLEPIFGDVFFPDAVDEWLRVNIDPRLSSVMEVLNKGNILLSIGARPKQIDNRLTQPDQ